MSSKSHKGLSCPAMKAIPLPTSIPEPPPTAITPSCEFELKYETPKNMVGRVSTNIERMNSVSGWYFGHFDSPIQREGNVFQNLPEVATHIKNGDPVFIYIKSLENEYIYQAISSKVMHESEVELYDAVFYDLLLVSCANKPLYNYRQLVKAKLIAIN